MTTNRRTRKSKLTITERGWAAHFIGAVNCRYRRNTLISDGERHVVVSSVGNMHYADVIRSKYPDMAGIQMIGADRYYETMVWHGRIEPPYIEADTSSGAQIQTGRGIPWGIHGEKPCDLPADVDNQADAIHETNVRWVTEHWNDIVDTHPS